MSIHWFLLYSHSFFIKSNAVTFILCKRVFLQLVFQYGGASGQVGRDISIGQSEFSFEIIVQSSSVYKNMKKMEGVEGEEVPEWEKCKENVQPRKQGRNVGKLSTGLVARTETDAASKLKVEKE